MSIKRHNIPLGGLRVFEAVARHQNMMNAAEELYVTHSAVSQQIRKLEEQLGVQLFDRKHKPLRLTAKGETLLRKVTSGLNLLAQGTDEVCHGEIEGELKVSCVPGLGANWFVHVLGDFLHSYEKVLAFVHSDPWQHPGLPEDVDLAVVYGSAEYPGLRVTRLGHPEFFPVCSPQLLGTRHAMRHPSELLKFTLLHNYGEKTWARWFSAAGVSSPEPDRDMIFDSAHLSLQAARAAHGIALADEATVSRDLSDGRLIRLFELSIPATHPYYIVTPPAGRLKHAARALESYLLEQFRMI
jgi:DNA-binding transcriptional LysR family regulator